MGRWLLIRVNRPLQVASGAHVRPSGVCELAPGAAPRLAAAAARVGGGRADLAPIRGDVQVGEEDVNGKVMDFDEEVLSRA